MIGAMMMMMGTIVIMVMIMMVIIMDVMTSLVMMGQNPTGDEVAPDSDDQGGQMRIKMI